MNVCVDKWIFEGEGYVVFGATISEATEKDPFMKLCHSERSASVIVFKLFHEVAWLKNVTDL